MTGAALVSRSRWYAAGCARARGGAATSMIGGCYYYEGGTAFGGQGMGIVKWNRVLDVKSAIARAGPGETN